MLPDIALDLLAQDAAIELGAVAARTSMPLAVNADSLATWFLEPLARLCAQHPVVFDLHRDDQDFTAGLLEEGAATPAPARPMLRGAQSRRLVERQVKNRKPLVAPLPPVQRTS